MFVGLHLDGKLENSRNHQSCFIFSEPPSVCQPARELTWPCIPHTLPGPPFETVAHLSLISAGGGVCCRIRAAQSTREPRLPAYHPMTMGISTVPTHTCTFPLFFCYLDILRTVTSCSPALLQLQHLLSFLLLFSILHPFNSSLLSLAQSKYTSGP